MKKLIPLVLLLIGVGGGVGAGLLLKPGPASSPEAQAGEENAYDTATHDASAGAPDKGDDHAPDAGGDLAYVKLNNQFVVPIVTDSSVEALVVMSLSLEVKPGGAEAVYLREPKLRDAFLQVMFDHANMGGFRGTFTDTGKLESLRRGFLDVAQSVLGKDVTAVLITDITRQTM